mgnify:CR=1 FL=1
MGVLDDIEEQVRRIAAARELSDDFAFGIWFLEEIEDLSQEEAELTVTGGPWDGGRDAVYYDEEISTLGIYQMKYSENRSYVLDAFTDLQRGLKAEYKEHPDRFVDLKNLNLKVVTKYSIDDEFKKVQKSQQRRIRSWLTKRGYSELSKRTQVEVFDLRKFAQLMERLYGVDLELDFREPPLTSEKTLLGLADARAFEPFIQREELLAFNIRKFLGIRKGSVNSKIKETLEDEGMRNSFWTFNNGIVCLCTDSNPTEDPQTFEFNNFTIVNGAQTVSTIVRFLNDNPIILDDEPIWVVCKTMCVEETDLDTAMKLTQTSNTQTPASSKDLRAVDQVHVRMESWLGDLGVIYSYKRGGRVTRGAEVVQMKEVAQAYFAYWEQQPHISFARAGTIFGDDDKYEKVFPPEEIDILFDSGSVDERREFVCNRLFPVRLLNGIRSHIRDKVKNGDDKKWKSLAYHVLYVYSIFIGEEFDSSEYILNRVDPIVESSVDVIYEGLKNLASTLGAEMPRDLKSEAFQEAIEDARWVDNYFGKQARTRIIEAID